MLTIGTRRYPVTEGGGATWMRAWARTPEALLALAVAVLVTADAAPGPHGR